MNSAVTDLGKTPSSSVPGLHSFWVQMAAMICFTVLLSLMLDFMKIWPQEWIVPIKEWITQFFTWLDKEAGIGPLKFKTVTRSVSWLLEQPLDWAEYILYRGIKAKQLPAIFWIFAPIICLCVLHKRFGLQRFPLPVDACLLGMCRCSVCIWIRMRRAGPEAGSALSSSICRSCRSNRFQLRRYGRCCHLRQHQKPRLACFCI